MDSPIAPNNTPMSSAKTDAAASSSSSQSPAVQVILPPNSSLFSYTSFLTFSTAAST